MSASLRGIKGLSVGEYSRRKRTAKRSAAGKLGAGTRKTNQAKARRRSLMEGAASIALGSGRGRGRGRYRRDRLGRFA